MSDKELNNQKELKDILTSTYSQVYSDKNLTLDDIVKSLTDKLKNIIGK